VFQNNCSSCCRVLLNKCQEEFEAGDQAMAAVDAREKAAAAKVAAGEVRPLPRTRSACSASCLLLQLKFSAGWGTPVNLRITGCAAGPCPWTLHAGCALHADVLEQEDVTLETTHPSICPSLF